MQPSDKLMSRLIALFGDPKTEDIDTFADEFRGALAKFSADVLLGVGDRCRDQFKWFPRISELITLAHDVKWDLEAPSRAAEQAKKAAEEAEQLRRDMARRAPKERIADLMAAFRANMADLDLKEAIRRPKLTAPTREDFEAMQRNSPNQIHRKPARS